MKFFTSLKVYFVGAAFGLMVACQPQSQPSSKSDLEPIAYDAKRIEVDSQIVDDMAVDSIINIYKGKVQQETSRIIGYTNKVLTKGKPESLLTNFITDLMLERGRLIAQENGQPLPNFAYSNNGGYRTVLPEGAITIGDIFQVMPFENKLVIIGLNAAQTELFFRNIADMGGEGVAGVKLQIKNKDVYRLRIDGEAYDKNHEGLYYMLTTDYLANGGGGDVLKEAPFRYDSDVLLRDAIVEYIEAVHAQGEKIDARLD